VRRPLFRLNRPDTEWVEKAIAEDVQRGQLEKGSSDWGFPAFPTKEAKAYKAIKRGRRLVVDYRELNKVTVRKFFLIPNSDYIKATVAGNLFLSVGDLKEGFNQVDNEEETRKKMAVLAASGCWLPRGLTFGPTNGPEDFQELVFTVFSRRLYRDWYLFVDDLSVATGRRPCHPPGPSGAHDVVTMVGRPRTEGERNAAGLGRAASSDPSPYAHVVVCALSLVVLLVICTVLERWRRVRRVHQDQGSVSSRGETETEKKVVHTPARVSGKSVTSIRPWGYVLMVLACALGVVARRRDSSLARQSPGCVTAGLLLDQTMAPEHTQYYGGETTLPVPTAPWQTGDWPKEDAVHLDVYVTGAKQKRKTGDMTGCHQERDS